MEYEVRQLTDHYEGVDYENGKSYQEDTTYFSVKITNMSKEEMDEILSVIKPIYEKHLKKSLDEDIQEYENWKKDPKRYRPAQCQAGL